MAPETARTPDAELDDDDGRGIYRGCPRFDVPPPSSPHDSTIRCDCFESQIEPFNCFYWQDYVSPQGEGDFATITQLNRMAVHPVPRVNKWKVLLEHLPISVRRSREDDRNDITSRILHPAGTGLVRPQGFRLCATRVGRRLRALAGGLACVWSGANR